MFTTTTSSTTILLLLLTSLIIILLTISVINKHVVTKVTAGSETS